MVVKQIESGKAKQNMIVLGVETSCDETAAAVVADGKEVLSSIVSSQIDVHHPYGGVVPELASRKHMEAIVPVVHQALESSGMHMHQLDAVAVTQGPGLVGALLVGFSFSKSFAMARHLPWIGVNHLEGHISSVFLEADVPGGHTNLYYVTSNTDYELLGQTRDDAVGEAYDKVSKMLGLGYPGGAVIDRLAAQGDARKIRFPRPYLDKSEFDFSFSGLKTAVNRYIQTHPDTFEAETADIAAGFQEAVVDVLAYKVIRAAGHKACPHIALVGGVAANSRLRERITDDAAAEGMSVFIPSLQYCGDNAAMIAAAGYHYLKRGDTSRLGDDVYSRVPRRPALQAVSPKQPDR
jgi:N6-L-threonylcarbamoyladenine synthase